ncbi:hypothetical protein [Corallibacter sp.]|uniref:hypothetical protein n=1 Tax=Corallibacter sp. TaxID=2038084 RepID=UPI003AB5CF89
MKKQQITFIFFSFLISLGFQSCKNEKQKNHFKEAKEIINSGKDDFEKYKLIFNSEIENELNKKQQIEIGEKLIKLNMGWNKIFIDRNNNLYQHSDFVILNNSNITFNRCFVDVYSSIEIDGKSYISESGYKINFNQNGRAELEIKHPLNNSFLLKENRKLIHLQESDLKKNIGSYNYSIKIRAINNKESVFLPLYDNDLSYMWSNWEHHDIKENY